MERQKRPPEKHKRTTTTKKQKKKSKQRKKKWKERKMHFSKMENGKLMIKANQNVKTEAATGSVL